MVLSAKRELANGIASDLRGLLLQVTQATRLDWFEPRIGSSREPALSRLTPVA